MTISPRDQAIVQVVVRFKQLSSKQIAELVFPNAPSRTTCDRALVRLVKAGTLARIERRLVGGSRGGSGQYCYQLGSQGWRQYNVERYRPARTINNHSLAIADTYLVFKRLEVEQRLTLLGMSSEPDCWLKVGPYELKPDLFFDLVQHDDEDKPRVIWLEVDLGTEGQRHVKDKLLRYWNAYEHNKYQREQAHDPTALAQFPWVLWVATDEPRVRELRWIISRIPEEARNRFRVTTMEKLPALFSS